MKKFLSVFFVLSLFCIASQAQPFTNLRILFQTTPKPLHLSDDGDTTLSIEVNSSVKFHISIYDSIFKEKIDTLKTVHYSWYFGDGKTATYTKLKTRNSDTTHTYTQSGLYYALLVLKVPDRHGKDSIISQKKVPIRVNIDPINFTARSDASTSVCYKDNVLLTGIADANKMSFNFNKIYSSSPTLISNKIVYSTDIINTGFQINRTFTAKDADSLMVSIKMEHSSAAELSIKLTCPNDSSIEIKKFAYTPDDRTFMGLPRLVANEAGKPYRFIFKTITGGEATTTMMNYEIGGLSQYPIHDAHGYLNKDSVGYTDLGPNDNISFIPPSPKVKIYKPEIAFSNLIGCPLNGKWTLTVTDNIPETPTTVSGTNTTVNNNDGYVYDWTLNFADTTYKPKWDCNITYPKTPNAWEWTLESNPSAFFSGAGDTFTVSTVPNSRGTHTYIFKVYDNWGFIHKRSVDVIASSPVINSDPLAGLMADPELTLHFTDVTVWSTKSHWDFNIINTTADTKVASATYDEKGTYRALLTSTSKFGCVDTVSVSFKIDVKPAVIKVPNVFTPNGDNVNDNLVFDQLEGLKTLEGKIFSRWGDIVLEINSLQDVKNNSNIIWNGNINNKSVKASPGVYYYYFSGMGMDKAQHSAKGYIYLITDK